MSSADAAAPPPDKDAGQAAATGPPPPAAAADAPTPPPPGDATPPPAPPTHYIYEFTLSQPPHPSPEAFYYHAPQTPPTDNENKLAAMLLLRHPRPPTATDRPPRLVPMTQRYQPHPHASGNPCTNCGITVTSTWRRLNPTRELSCNSCSDYYRRRGRYRPVANLPLRTLHVDLVGEGDTWAGVVERRRRPEQQQ